MEIHSTRQVLLKDLGACCGLERCPVRAEKGFALLRAWIKAKQRSKGAAMNHAILLPSRGLKSQSLDVAAPSHHRCFKRQWGRIYPARGAICCGSNFTQSVSPISKTCDGEAATFKRTPLSTGETM